MNLSLYAIKEPLRLPLVAFCYLPLALAVHRLSVRASVMPETFHSQPANTLHPGAHHPIHHWCKFLQLEATSCWGLCVFHLPPAMGYPLPAERESSAGPEPHLTACFLGPLPVTAATGKVFRKQTLKWGSGGEVFIRDHQHL